MPDVFISYARQDQAVARKLSEMLEAEGQRVFFDQAIAAGESYTQRIDEALTNAKAVVVLLSRNSNRSEYVQAELRNGLRRGQVVIPVLLDDEATNNWVWPLISDRETIELKSPNQIDEVARLVNRAIRHTNAPEHVAVLASAPRSATVPWITLLVAVLSALVGALAVWLSLPN